MEDYGYVVGSTRAEVHRLTHSLERNVTTGHQFLQQTKVSDLFPIQHATTGEHRKLVTIDAETPINTAFEMLKENKILSAPIYHSGGRHKNHYSGFLDMIDIVTHLIQVNETAESSPKSFDEILKQEGRTQTADSIAGACGRNQWYAIDETAPLKVAIDAMVKQKLQRVPVLDLAGDLVTVVSQSLVVQLLDTNLKVFGFGHVTVKQLELGVKDVLHIGPHRTLLDAFRVINKHQVSGVAVTDEEGRLIGNISASDLRTVSFGANVEEQLRRTTGSWVSEVMHQTPVAVTTECTLDSLFEIMVSKQLHRVYITDADKKPIGVISLSDILQIISEHL